MVFCINTAWLLQAYPGFYILMLGHLQPTKKCENEKPLTILMKKDLSRWVLGRRTHNNLTKTFAARGTIFVFIILDFRQKGSGLKGSLPKYRGPSMEDAHEGRCYPEKVRRDYCAGDQSTHIRAYGPLPCLLSLSLASSEHLSGSLCFCSLLSPWGFELKAREGAWASQPLTTPPPPNNDEIKKLCVTWAMSARPRHTDQMTLERLIQSALTPCSRAQSQIRTQQDPLREEGYEKQMT